MSSDITRKPKRIHDLKIGEIDRSSVHRHLLGRETGIRPLLAHPDPSRELLRVALGPIDDIRRTGIFDAAAHLASETERLRRSLSQPASEILSRLSLISETATLLQSSEVARFRESIASLEKQFVLPGAAEAVKVLRSSAVQKLVSDANGLGSHIAQLQEDMTRMSVPWLDVGNTATSVFGFCRLQELGKQIRVSPPFNVLPAGRIRLCLGDWRERLDVPSSIMEDPGARTAFYVERGLDRSLTDFPAPAFAQAVLIAGLESGEQSQNPELDHQLGEEEHKQEGFARTNRAHNLLQRLEGRLRRLIEQLMETEYGKNWIKRQVPPDVREDWAEKRQKALDHGEEAGPPIDYADFTHYEKIILRRDNWDRVFSSIFRRNTLVLESLQRLYPIRLCTMHSRLITQDDELYLYAETRRLNKAMDTASFTHQVSGTTTPSDPEP